MKRRYAWWVLALLIILTAAAYGYVEYNRERKDSREAEPKFTVAAKALLDEFARDETLANKKYSGQHIIVAVDGMVKEIVADEQGLITLLLGEADNASSIKCMMDSKYADEAKLVKKGESVTVKGNFNGYKSDELGIGAELEMNFCVIEK